MGQLILLWRVSRQGLEKLPGGKPRAASREAQVFPAGGQRGHLVLFALQSLSRVQLSAAPWMAAHQASLSFTIS